MIMEDLIAVVFPLGINTIQLQPQKVGYYVALTFDVDINGSFLGIFKKEW